MFRELNKDDFGEKEALVTKTECKWVAQGRYKEQSGRFRELRKET